jgi:hypothetical protein
MTHTDESEYRLREPRDRGLRVSDAEREAVAAILRREHVAGRVDSVEFDERLSHCLAAKTYAELDGLIVDLPSQGSAPRRSGRILAWPFPLLPVVAVVIAAMVLSHGHLFWLAFPLFFLFVLRPLLWRRGPGSWGYAVRQSRDGAAMAPAAVCDGRGVPRSRQGARVIVTGRDKLPSTARNRSIVPT